MHGEIQEMASRRRCCVWDLGFGVPSSLRGKPIAFNYGLLWLLYGLLGGIVACWFWLLGVPGRG